MFRRWPDRPGPRPLDWHARNRRTGGPGERAPSGRRAAATATARRFLWLRRAQPIRQPPGLDRVAAALHALGAKPALAGAAHAAGLPHRLPADRRQHAWGGYGRFGVPTPLDSPGGPAGRSGGELRSQRLVEPRAARSRRGPGRRRGTPMAAAAAAASRIRHASVGVRHGHHRLGWRGAGGGSLL